jgi:hypothetical protein
LKATDNFCVQKAEGIANERSGQLEEERFVAAKRALGRKKSDNFGGNEFSSAPKVMRSKVPRACCECEKVETAHWSTLVGPITILKLGLQNLRDCLDSEDVEMGVLTELASCERAVASLEVAHAQITKRKNGHNVAKMVDFPSFMHHAKYRLKSRAHATGCTLMLEDFTSLPKIDIERKRLWCFFNMFFRVVLDVGANGVPWKLELFGRGENGFVYVHVKAHHPERRKVLEETWDNMETNKPPDCQIPLEIDFKRGSGQESLVFGFPAAVNEGLFVKD